MTIKKIFKSTIPSCSYFFKDGMQAAFIGGKYVTDMDKQIAELMNEVGVIGAGKSRHPYIYVDEAEIEIDTEAPSPLELIKAEMYEKARADILEEQKRAMNATANVSSTVSKDFAQSLGNTATIAQAAESTGDNAGSIGVTSMSNTTSEGTPAVIALNTSARLAALVGKK